jgi:hypothetical protein
MVGHSPPTVPFADELPQKAAFTRLWHVALTATVNFRTVAAGTPTWERSSEPARTLPGSQRGTRRPAVIPRVVELALAKIEKNAEGERTPQLKVGDRRCANTAGPLTINRLADERSMAVDQHIRPRVPTPRSTSEILRLLTLA